MAKVIMRMWAAWGLAAALSLAAVTPAAAMSGSEWRQLSEGRRDAFVTGVLEGWGVAVWQDPQGPIQSGSALAKLAGTLDCVTQRKMRLRQVWAISSTTTCASLPRTGICRWPFSSSALSPEACAR